MGVKERLKNYKYDKLELKRLQMRIEEFKTKLESTTQNLSFTSKSNTYNDEMMVRYLELLEIWKKRKDEIMRSLDEIDSLIAELDNPERLVMTLRYIDDLTWDEVAIAGFMSVRKAHNIHGRALSILKKISEK